MREKKYYQNAKRFDESDIYQSQEYSSYVKELLDWERLIEELYGPSIRFFLSAYKDVLSELTEFECFHYFQEGFHAGQPYTED